MKRIGVIGARGYTGAELLPMLDRHPGFELAAVSSRQLAGERVCDHFEHSSVLRIEELSPEQVGEREVDAWVLALPNDLSDPYVDAIDPNVAIVDLSSDHRFDDGWAYGLPEHFRASYGARRRIANPGCYATGAQVALRPVVDLLAGIPSVFGVSGFSGAGTTPSDRNDPEMLADNLMPYKLVRHGHEAEIGHHLGHDVYFMPHVAPFFRGISLTVSTTLKSVDLAEIRARYAAQAEGEPLFRVTDDAPQVRDAACSHFVTVGGFAFDEARQHLVVVATLDNLLKGAATQALQNLNLICGFDELEGIA